MDLRILSFDCANKSLAYIDINILINTQKLKEINNELTKINQKLKNITKNHNENTNTHENLTHILETILNLKTNLQNLEKEINGFFKINKFDVCDILNGINANKCNDIYKIKQLKKFLDQQIPKTHYDYIIIEQQTFVISRFSNIRNIGTSMIQAAITMHFHDKNIGLINPKEKNKIYFNHKLKYENFITPGKKRYNINKTHTIENLKYINKIFSLNICENMKKTYMDDIADATLQIFVLLKNKNKFIC